MGCRQNKVQTYQRSGTLLGGFGWFSDIVPCKDQNLIRCFTLIRIISVRDSCWRVIAYLGWLISTFWSKNLVNICDHSAACTYPHNDIFYCTFENLTYVTVASIAIITVTPKNQFSMDKKDINWSHQPYSCTKHLDRSKNEEKRNTILFL